MGDLWVFGYGSLMWKPGFPHLEARPARLHGYHRSLCVRSWVYRGTPQTPGLVLGLDWGGSCIGRAFRVAEADKPSAVDYLYQRELVTDVYVPKLTAARLDDGRVMTMLTFAVDRRHAQYAGRLGIVEAAEIVRHASGRNGPNVDYIMHTVAHLDELGIADSLLHRVQALLSRRP